MLMGPESMAAIGHATLEALSELHATLGDLLVGDTGYHAAGPEDMHRHLLVDMGTRDKLEHRQRRLAFVQTRLRRALGLPPVDALAEVGERYATTEAAGEAAGS